ncbi:hypothetical protein A3SI_20192 [Nitritalea halalkaliphila LW7]|uniref:Uncharacterized protein n=1 Tax=Nitritalea halalkaliphila LW7 TaxID=1189621 RepID=I5BQU1_9BACT|nr:hypothetical protein [Nitritalea halalkaliphila]EIM71943.1 hypothetical protein A3SI_20192 [Nitritalea halalkaliphila LW7]
MLHSFTGSARNAVNWAIAQEPYQYFGLNPNWFTYEVLGETIIDDRPVYILSFHASSKAFDRFINKWGRSHKKKLQQGVFYIDQQDYGLHRMHLKWENANPTTTRMSVGRQYKHTILEESLNAYYRRTEEGRYVFTYVNQSRTAIGYGYKGEGFHEGKQMREFAEMYALASSPGNLSYDELRARYLYGLRESAPYYKLNYLADLYNGWIFTSGRSTYDPTFWEKSSYPPLPDEQRVHADLAEHRPLEAQFADFSNIQLYINPLLKRRHKISDEPYWNQMELYAY